MLRFKACLIVTLVACVVATACGKQVVSDVILPERSTESALAGASTLTTPQILDSPLILPSVTAQMQPVSPVLVNTVQASVPQESPTPAIATSASNTLQVADPQSWMRYMDPIGISYEYPVGWYMRHIPSMLNLTQGEVAWTRVYRADASQVYVGPNTNVAIGLYKGDKVIKEVFYPFELVYDTEEEPHFLTPVDLSGATKASLFLWGRMGHEGVPDYQPYCCQGIGAQVYNEACQLEIRFGESFGERGPFDEVGVRPLDEVVAEHFPVLDHMYRSVQFPPECVDEPTPMPVPAPPSPLATPVQP